MPTPILMPALSPTMEEGRLAKWLVAEGAQISAGDVIAEIETDKATMEVEAVDEGVLGRILVQDGAEGVRVNAPIALLLDEGEDKAALDGFNAGAAAPPAPPAVAKPAPAAQSAAAAPAPAPTRAPTPAASTSTPAAPAAAAPAAQMAPAQMKNGARVFASPLAKRLAAERGLDLAALTGTGPRGRIVKRDVESALASGVAAQKPAAAMAPPAGAAAGAAAPPASISAPAPAMSDEAVRALFADRGFEEVPHDSMRRTIARRLTESKANIPHFYQSVDCRLDALLAIRARLNAHAPKGDDGGPAWKISVNDFVVKALAVALRRVPDANVSWTEGAMLRHAAVDVGVAVAIPGGLITPIVRDADAKGLAAISTEMKDYAARARARRLKPQEYQGGVTAVSNLGMYGVKSFSAVINPPHATILAVGAGERRPVVTEDGSLGVATVMTATLSTDHRAVDGATAAELLSAFRMLVEDPAAMLA